MRVCFWSVVFGAVLVAGPGCAAIASLPDDYTLAADGAAADGDTDGGDDTLGDDAACGHSFCPCDASYFCSDFDEDPPNAGWTKATVDNGGYSTFTTDFSYSPPRSFYGTLNGSVNGHARLNKDVPVPTFPASIHFAVVIRTPTGTLQLGSVATVDVSKGTSTCTVSIDARADGYHANIYGTCPVTSGGDHPIANTARYFDNFAQLTVDFTATTLTVAFPNGNVFSTPFSGLTADRISINIGPSSDNPLRAYYDNVVLMLQL